MPILSTRPPNRDSVLDPVARRDRKRSFTGNRPKRKIIRAVALAVAFTIGTAALLIDDVSVKINTIVTGITPADAAQAARDCLSPPGGPGRTIARCTTALDGGDPDPRVKADIFVARAALYLAANEPWKAIGDYGAALEIRPDWSKPYFGRAQAQLPVERFQAMLDDIDEAVRLDPSTGPSAHRWRGIAFYYLNRPDPAIEELTLALDTRPEDSDARTFRGFALLSQIAITKAVADFDRVIAEKPDRLVHYGRAQARLLTGDPEGALDDADRAIALGGDGAVYQWARCRALAYLERGGEALAACDAGLALDPTQPILYAARALARWQTSDHPGARDDLTRVPEALRAPNYAMQEKLFIRLLTSVYLHRAGYDPGPVDGIDSPRFREAIAAYQRALGLPADGKASAILLARLRQTVG